MTAHPPAPNGDALEMIRSEEQLRVGSTRVPVRRARLERFEITEMQTITVPVIRQDVRVVYEPIDPAEDVRERSTPPRPLVLMQERVVVTTERVPVELVSMVVETVTEQQTVTGDVRTEQIIMASIPAATPTVRTEQ